MGRLGIDLGDIAAVADLASDAGSGPVALGASPGADDNQANFDGLHRHGPALPHGNSQRVHWESRNGSTSIHDD